MTKMANGEPMNSLSDAKAVLAEWPEQGPSFIDLDDKSRREALSAMIAEVESLTNEVSRLTAPLDADEGRELVHRLRVIALPDGLEAADLIERQAARIAAMGAEIEALESPIATTWAETRAAIEAKSGRFVMYVDAPYVRLDDVLDLVEPLCVENERLDARETALDAVLALIDREQEAGDA